MDSTPSARINTTDGPHTSMADMVTCACGWTVISPQGRNDVKKHVFIHLNDSHPGTVLAPDEMEKMIKSV